MYFLVKVKVDVNKLAEFGKKVANREFDNSAIKFTYCLKNDLTVGYSIWETADEKEFENKFNPYRPFYKEIEIPPVILPSEAQKMIIDQIKK
jgi:hypothetical protein